MGSDRKEELTEQYEDALFALMLDQYAEEEGNRLLKEFEDAKARNDLPEVPADLDAKCRALIKKAYKNSRRKEVFHRSICSIGRIAAVLFITLGLCTTLVFSVDALRIPVMNYIIARYEQFTSIGADSTPSTTEATDFTCNNTTEESPLAGILPDTFNVINNKLLHDGTMNCCYESADGCIVFFDISNYNGLLNIDTENTATETIRIMEHDGLFIDKGNELTILWFDPSVDKTYQLRAIGIQSDLFWTIANSVAEQYDNMEDNAT